MTTPLTFDDALASTYRKTAEVIAFPADREIEFTLGGGQRQVIRPGGWVVLGTDGRAHGVDGAVFAATYERTAPQTYRKKTTIRAYQVDHPFSLGTTLADGFTETDAASFPAGTWAVRNPGGEVYAISADEFPKLYEKVSAPAPGSGAHDQDAQAAAPVRHPALLKRLTSDGPKRILSLDGGGVRGALTLGILAKIEAELRKARNDDNAVLADHFDLIGGTSTGAIIAAALARGRSVEYITKMYLKLAGEIFGKKRLAGGLLWDRYNHAALEAALEDEFGDLTVGDTTFRTAFCIVTKRVDTASTWPVINHPLGSFYPHNAALRVTDVLRASTAAPTYFAPKHLAETHWKGVFADGGVSMHNNPALQLFFVATLRGFPFGWQARKGRLSIVSVGTGRYSLEVPVPEKPKPSFWASTVPELLMADAGELVETTLQYLAKSPTARSIDRQIDKLSNDLLGDVEHLNYVRYNPTLDIEAFARVGEVVKAKDLDKARDLAAAGRVHALLAIGTACAEVSVGAEALK